MLQEDGKGDEFFEPEEVNERLGRCGQQNFDSIHMFTNEYNVAFVNTINWKSIQNVDP